MCEKRKSLPGKGRRTTTSVKKEKEDYVVEDTSEETVIHPNVETRHKDIVRSIRYLDVSNITILK